MDIYDEAIPRSVVLIGDITDPKITARITLWRDVANILKVIGNEHFFGGGSIRHCVIMTLYGLWHQLLCL